MQWTSFLASENQKTSRMSIEQRAIAIGFMNAGVAHAVLRHICCIYLMEFISKVSFLAHLSQRLIGELIVFQCSGVRRHRRRRRRRRLRCCPPFSNVFSSETAWPIKAKFYVEPPWEGGTKVYINGPGHMTKMAAMPIYGKNFKKNLLQNQMSYDIETCPVASGKKLFKVYINDDPGLTLTYFTARPNLVT